MYERKHDCQIWDCKEKRNYQFLLLKFQQSTPWWHIKVLAVLSLVYIQSIMLYIISIMLYYWNWSLNWRYWRFFLSLHIWSSNIICVSDKLYYHVKSKILKNFVIKYIRCSSSIFHQSSQVTARVDTCLWSLRKQRLEA